MKQTVLNISEMHSNNQVHYTDAAVSLIIINFSSLYACTTFEITCDGKEQEGGRRLLSKESKLLQMYARDFQFQNISFKFITYSNIVCFQIHYRQGRVSQKSELLEIHVIVIMA
jgi:hypothetical protein